MLFSFMRLRAHHPTAGWPARHPPIGQEALARFQRKPNPQPQVYAAGSISSVQTSSESTTFWQGLFTQLLMSAKQHIRKGWDGMVTHLANAACFVATSKQGTPRCRVEEGGCGTIPPCIDFQVAFRLWPVCLGRGALLAYLCSLHSQSIQSLVGTCRCGQPCC